MVLTDPRAIRALAHPARSRIIDELYQGQVRTASELARVVDLSPSATSYHLRALQRWGIVERADPTNDGRERPWRAPGRTLSFQETRLGPAGEALYDSIAATYLRQLRAQLAAWTRSQPTEDPAWAEESHVNRSFLWLTAAEAAALTQELTSVVRQYIGDRDAANHPVDTRRVALFSALVPLVDSETDGETPDPGRRADRTIRSRE